jgi:hypothetical protein
LIFEKEYDSVMHSAARFGNISLVKELLKNKAQVSNRNMVRHVLLNTSLTLVFGLNDSPGALLVKSMGKHLLMLLLSLIIRR